MEEEKEKEKGRLPRCGKRKGKGRRALVGRRRLSPRVAVGRARAAAPPHPFGSGDGAGVTSEHLDGVVPAREREIESCRKGKKKHNFVGFFGMVVGAGKKGKTFVCNSKRKTRHVSMMVVAV